MPVDVVSTKTADIAFFFFQPEASSRNDRGDKAMPFWSRDSAIAIGLYDDR